MTSYGAVDGEVALRLMQNDTEVASTVSTDGSYSLLAPVPGEYELIVSKANHVTRIYSVVVADEHVTFAVKIHLLGDINGDGKANAIDKRMIYNHMNDASKALTGYAFDCANINKDDYVNAIDKRMLYNHMNDSSKALW